MQQHKKMSISGLELPRKPPPSQGEGAKRISPQAKRHKPPLSFTSLTILTFLKLILRDCVPYLVISKYITSRAYCDAKKNITCYSLGGTPFVTPNFLAFYIWACEEEKRKVHQKSSKVNMLTETCWKGGRMGGRKCNKFNNAKQYRLKFSKYTT